MSAVLFSLSGSAWRHIRELAVAYWCCSVEMVFTLLRPTTAQQAGVKLTEPDRELRKHNINSSLPHRSQTSQISSCFIAPPFIGRIPIAVWMAATNYTAQCTTLSGRWTLSSVVVCHNSIRRLLLQIMSKWHFCWGARSMNIQEVHICTAEVPLSKQKHEVLP